MRSKEIESLRVDLWAISNSQSSNMTEVKHLIQEVIKKFNGSPVARALSQGVIIDFALLFRDQDSLNKAIKKLRVLLAKPDPEILEKFQCEVAYYVATALYGLHSMSEERHRKWTHLVDSNRWFRKSESAFNEYVSSELRARVLVNHGNTLAELNRWYEAIEHYYKALRCDPSHSMAKGNLAMELSRYSWRMGREASASLMLARSLMDDALSQDSRIELTGAHDARMRFEGVSKIIDEQLAKQFRKSDVGENGPQTSAYDVSHELSGLYSFLSDHSLFLHYDIDPPDHIGSQSDTLFFNYFTPLDKIDKFAHLSRIFNEMKESFSLARYLLWIATTKDGQQDEYSSWTGYADNLEYADYGLKSSLAKSAFTTAYGILDKIALLLYREFEITSQGEKDVYFSNIFDMIKALEKSEFNNLKSLDAISSMSRELHQSEAGGWMDTRNRLTHRHLVPHDWLMMVGVGSTANEHIRIDALVQESLNLLQFTKSAMLYLVDMLNERDAKTHRSRSRPITMPMFYMFQIGYVGETKPEDEIDDEEPDSPI